MGMESFRPGQSPNPENNRVEPARHSRSGDQTDRHSFVIGLAKTSTQHRSCFSVSSRELVVDQCEEGLHKSCIKVSHF